MFDVHTNPIFEGRIWIFPVAPVVSVDKAGVSENVDDFKDIVTELL